MYRLLFVLLFAALAPGLNAQQVGKEFVQKTNYLLYIPETYNTDTSQRWPLVMFLHGSGESGNDVEKVKANGPPKLIAAGKQFPFLVVSPQAASSREGFQPLVLKELLDELKKNYRVDPDRVYLTGLSMGGYASWKLAQEYPEEFAAVIPVCGGGDTSTIWKLRHMPVWNFHGGQDRNVPISESEKMVSAVRKYNPAVRFTIYPETGHNSWEQAYDTDSLYSWMLSKTRFHFTVRALSTAELAKVEGRYAGPDEDSFDIRLAGDQLQIAMVGNPNDMIALKPSGDGHFFIFENQLTELVFDKTRSGFVLYDRNSRRTFRKLRKGK